MTPTGIQLFQLLKPRLGERETEALINFVDVKIKENNQDIHEINLRALATKEDISIVKQELIKVETRLEVKIADVKSDVIRWVFAFFVALMLAIIGLYFKH
jgi:hypothetical protein